jgi:dihydroxyacetone kinase
VKDERASGRTGETAKGRIEARSAEKTLALADGFRAVLRQLDADIDRSSSGKFLMKVGSAFAGSAGGTSGPMWGTAFLRAGINSKEK